MAYSLFLVLRGQPRKVAVLFASYVFYALAGPTHLAILLWVTVVAHVTAASLERRASGVRLTLGLLGTLGPLLVWKYLTWALQSIPWIRAPSHGSFGLLNIALPVGISFYTLQAASHLIDVKRGDAKAANHLLDTALYLAFFPQILAGPIERGHVLLPQIRRMPTPSRRLVFTGFKILLWGYFCKLVLADGLARIIDEVSSNPAGPRGGSLATVSFLYSLQIFFDFLGYTSIARGLGRMMGIRLSRNFLSPYRARSIRDFWRRWHITLTSWFRDYVYFSLGGSRRGRGRWVLAVTCVFLLSGLWHGAALGFIVWGAIHGMLYLGGRVTSPLRARLASATGLSRLPRLHGALQVVVTFILVTLAWLPFRIRDLRVAYRSLVTIITPFASASWTHLDPALLRADSLLVIMTSVAFLVADGTGLMRRLTETIPQRRGWVGLEIGFVNLMLVLVTLFGDLGTREFIYFRF